MGKARLLLLPLFYFLHFFLPSLLGAQVFNVSTPAEFQDDLITAQTNGEDDVINVQADMNITSTLTYTGEQGHTLTINGNGHSLDGGGSAQIMYINTTGLANDTNADITIQNLIFKNGKADSSNGGGLYINTNSKITIKGCTFNGNTAGNYGGGAYVYSGSKLTLTNNTFSGNTAGNYDGGGAFIGTSSGTATLENNTFSGNTANRHGGGAYVFTNDGTITLTNNTFNGNTATYNNGGGAYVWTDSGIPTLTNNTFRENYAAWGGGVYVYAYSAFSDAATLTNNTFSKNSAGWGGGGAAVVTYSATINLTNNTFSQNTGTWIGGGAYVETQNNSATANIYNNVIWGNTANYGGNDGDDLYVDSDYVNDIGTINLYNNDLGPNSNFVTGQSEDLYITNTSKYNHDKNIVGDPKLVDPANGDFHLQAGSPCIDAGDNNAPGLPSTDFEGGARIVNGTVDIGADEYGAGPPAHTLTVTKTGTGSGRVTSDPAGIDCGGTCSSQFVDGTVVTLTVTADAGSVFSSWAGDCQGCGQNTQCQITIDSDKQCTVTFDLTHTVTPSVGSGQGSIDPSTPQTVKHNETVQFTLTPAQCYHIDRVGGTCGGTLNGNVFTTNPVTQDCTVVANFAINTYTITATAGTGGSINPSGNVVVNCGADQTFTITPDAGYRIEDVVVDGQSVGAVNSYTFTNVTSNHTIQASFIQDDGDGVDASVEDGAPNGGDGNADGVPDKLQSHVTSLPSATGQGYITVELREGCSQNENVRAQREDPDDPGYTYPFGLVSFELPCSSARVRVYFHGSNDLRGYIYRKYGPTTPGDPATTAWYTLPGVTFGTATIGGNIIAYAEFTLTDGQIGDDTAVDGRIVDQGGPGRPMAITAVPTMTEWGMIVFMVLAGFTAVYYLRRMRMASS